VTGVARLVAAALLVGGCTLFSASYPDDYCDENADCFRAQGEVCDLEQNRCVPGVDAAPPPPDAGPTPDAPPTPDAAPPDAATADASDQDGGE
jgi:hypothetical protein